MAEPRIEIAARAGVCYGVERALGMAHEAARCAPTPVRTLGPLIHNPLVVSELSQAGVDMADAVDDIQGGTVIIRAHGVVPTVIDRARAAGINVLDATCPYVKRVHSAAQKLVREGYQLIVVGESGHPEVEGIVGHAGGQAHVVSTVDNLDGIDLARRVGVVVQTTQTIGTLQEIVSALIARAEEVRVVNTICSATQERQKAARELAERADVMVVIGGKNSGNTRRLAQICKESCERTHHIEDSSELDEAWFQTAGLIGITAGASTPASHIDKTVRAIEEMLGGSDER